MKPAVVGEQMLWPFLMCSLVQCCRDNSRWLIFQYSTPLSKDVPLCWKISFFMTWAIFSLPDLIFRVTSGSLVFNLALCNTSHQDCTGFNKVIQFSQTIKQDSFTDKALRIYSAGVYNCTGN